jgi:hypothetical protein
MVTGVNGRHLQLALKRVVEEIKHTQGPAQILLLQMVDWHVQDSALKIFLVIHNFAQYQVVLNF